jgi:DNA processing protein
VNYTDNALNVLTALTYKGIGKAWVAKNLPNNESEKTVVSLLNQSLKMGETTVGELQQRKHCLKQQIEKLSDYMDGLIALGDSNFPQHRGKVKNSEKPVALFYKGDVSLLGHGNKNIAVIGVLEPDQSTQITERKMVHQLVEKGATIVSGLANGCDAIAHDQTLISGGKTVAILPSPLHNILPAGNRGLAMQILQMGGLLVTEYLNDATSKMAFNGRYQERDRLQALFSDAIVLASSYAKNDLGNDSGSRLAMEYARQYEIPRAVMYEQETDSHNPKYDLNRQLMYEQQDILVIDNAEMEGKVTNLLNSKPKIESNASQTGLF